MSVEICGKDWISYSNTKCFRVLDRKGSVDEAKGNCSELDERSTLITIESLNEQKFIENLVQKHNTLLDRVWIGLEWNDNTFKWMDGSDVKYENRGEYSNYFRNKDMRVNRCFQMSTIGKNLGKWSDDYCGENYLMACQKKQASPSNFQIDLYSQKSRLEFIEQSTIPIGFLYTQFPSQSSPQQLWPSLQWTEVTQSYAGLFFRAEGGNSSSYGQLQLASSPGLSRIYQEKDPNGWFANDNIIDVEQVKPTVNLGTGMWINSNDKLSLSFLVSNEEVRPINKAIKIWKRTG